MISKPEILSMFKLFSGGTDGIGRWLNSKTPDEIFDRLSNIDRKPLSKEELNQLLILSHEAGVSDGFFEYYWLIIPSHPYDVTSIPDYQKKWIGNSRIHSLYHLRWGLYRLYVDSLLYFGNIRTGYRNLRTKTQKELEDFFEPKRFDTKKMSKRGRALSLSDIPKEHRYLISEMACKSYGSNPEKTSELKKALICAWNDHKRHGGGEISIRNLIGGTYLFSWDDIPGNDNVSLIKFLKKRYSIDWVDTTKIEKIDDGRTIRLCLKNNFISIKLNDEKTKVNLKIDHGITDAFNARTENSKLNIYEGTYNEDVRQRFLFSANEILDHKIKKDKDIEIEYAAVTKSFSNARIAAVKNTEYYLSMINDLDIYVATSMREPKDFRDMANNCEKIFLNERLKKLNLRFFDPTLSATNGHEDKGLIECLMVKTAEVLVYFAGQKESYGKDAEAAMALSLGKPVIFFCDEKIREDFYRDVHPLSRLIDFNTGVAVGAIVTSSIDQVIELLCRIFKNKMEYKLEQHEGYIRLKECLTESVVRLQTNDKLLSETFWNYYNEQSKNHLSSANGIQA